MAEQRARLSASEQAEHARAAVGRFLALPVFGAACARVASGGAASMCGYVSIRGELDPAAALAAARTAGLAVALPRVDTAWPPRLRFHRTRGEADLTDGPYGLTEPSPSCPELAVEDLDILLVPGLAFDAEGRRVGYGGGYYDDVGGRLRASGRPGIRIGFAHDFQIIERCPSDERDVAVDLVITERRLLEPGAAS
ncbi:MAG: 5-formyltetrahydrofolate cyclo-ligase [Myxococcales bacterium]|nr:5-formyltetrahydrofolate cyclo-ligase [Myxococcales bacterium]